MLTVFVTYHYFLGLRTLTVINDAANMAGLGGVYNMEIDYEDKNVFDMLSTGRTEGVFQLESAGMKQFIKELKPRNMEDIIAGISLYRPGPMDFIPKYIEGKEKSGSITYDCPQLEPILAPTYGCIVYQEQVMQIVRNLAGYSFGRSDLVRRAMSKKKTKVMEEERRNFVYGNEEEGVKGCIANGIPESIANKIYDEMIDFAKYAFNKSHAAAYAVVAYQTAYLKYYHTVEFMAALLTSVKANPNKVLSYIMTCRQMGIEIIPPDINKGYGEFRVSDGRIMYGMSAIKGIGTPVIAEVTEERERGGDFTSMQDFITRMTSKEANRHTIENFIKSGAFDCLPGNRRQKMMVFGSIIDSVNHEKREIVAGQLSLFDMADTGFERANEIKFPDVPEYDKEELLAFEKETLSIYISGHPLEDYTGLMEKNCTRNSADFIFDEEDTDSGMAKVHDGENVIIGGMITAKNVKITRKNTTMAFITVEDLYGSVEVVVFPNSYEKKKELIQLDSKVFIKGRANVEEDRAGKVICQDIIPFNKVPCELWIRFADMAEFQSKENLLYSKTMSYDGNDTICIYITKEKLIKKLPKSRCTDARRVVKDRVLEEFGENAVAIKEKSIEK